MIVFFDITQMALSFSLSALISFALRKKAGPSMNGPAIALRLYYIKKSERTGS